MTPFPVLPFVLIGLASAVTLALILLDYLTCGLRPSTGSWRWVWPGVAVAAVLASGVLGWRVHNLVAVTLVTAVLGGIGGYAAAKVGVILARKSL